MNTADTFIWESEVRDSELDLQGIVNNSNYLVYMEHARHKYLKYLEIDFQDMHVRGIDLLLARSEIDFKASLQSGDEFFVVSKLSLFGRLRFVFDQQVVRKSDEKVVVEAKNIGVCIDRSTGRPIIPIELKQALNLE